jgi:hypothetical protein
MSAEERADLFERARWELIALLEGVQDAGYFRFAVSNDSGRPSLELLVDQHDTGGDDAIPDRVAEYLGLSKGASK